MPLCVCLCVRARICVYIGVHVHRGGQRSTLNLALSWSQLIQLGSLSTFLVLGFSHSLLQWVGSGILNTGPDACLGSTLLQLSPQLHNSPSLGEFF